MAIGVVGFTTRFRTFTPAQLEATYKKIADLGYTGPEGLFGGRAGIPWKEDWKLVQKYGLKVADVHGDLDKPDEAKKKADALGVNILGIKSLPGEMMNSADGFKAYAEKINNWAKNFKGYKLQYHNHAQEFRNFPSLNGKCGLQILIEETDPEVVCFQIDTFWSSAAGADPAQWILKVKNRIPVVHYKDYAIDWKAPDNELGSITPRFAEVGQGNINWEAVTEACGQAGVQWYCVEQDRTALDEFESLKMSIAYMKGLGLK
jgi:sugar phosphate isomerase/epimerase